MSEAESGSSGSSGGKKHGKTLTNIPTSRFSRGMKLAGLTASVGAQTLGTRFANLFSDAEGKKTRTFASQIEQATQIAETLSQMKGAAMKLGQLLSIHGEDMFPPEVTKILAKLQGSSDEMAFAEIRKVLVSELGEDFAERLQNFSEHPIAAASIGQVHRAKFHDSDVAVKVQYPGIDQSIDSDIDTLASLFSLLTRFPNMEGLHSITDEIKVVLKQETDYTVEGERLALFREIFSDDENILVPKYYPEVSTRHVLTTELVRGISVQEFGGSTASLAARNFLGRKFLEVFYRELFEIGMVQTDPNFANYKVLWSFGIQDPGLVLLDFGAVKTYSEDFRKNYRRLIHGALSENYEEVREATIAAGFLTREDSEELVRMHWDLLNLFMEPFHTNGPFKWAENDLAERIRKYMPKFILGFKLRPPPRDFIFLNRKVIGVYFFCQAIKAEFSPRDILVKYSGYQGT